MILYNVTMNIEPDVHEEWLKWMKEAYIPHLLNSGLVLENRVMRLLYEVENAGITYAFQYYLNNVDDCQRLEIEFINPMQKELTRRFPNKFVDFATLLEVIK
jgi:hypothetical protein